MVPWTPVQKPWTKQSAPAWQQGKGVQWPKAAQGAAWTPQWSQSGWKGGGGWAPQVGGWKGGGGAWAARKPPPTVQPNFEVDSIVRQSGTVDFYAKWKGYGFITLNQTGLVPNDRIFVHWRNVQSDDRFPFLVKGLEVEFSIMKHRDNFNPSMFTLRAGNVTLAGGMNISVQDDLDAQEKTFVGGQHLRYTGNLKFFNPRLGFGYVTMDQGYDVEPGVPTELRVETSEVNAGGRQPRMMENIAVEFGIWKTNRGMYKVYNMTLPGGHPLTQDALENRISMGQQAYKGEVTMWNWRQGWGFIRTDPSMPLPPRVVAKLQQQAQAAMQRGRRITEDKLLYFRRVDCAMGYAPQRQAQVSFQLYIDDKGAGACEVNGFGGLM